MVFTLQRYIFRELFRIFVHPATPKDADLSDVFEFWDVVNAEDRSICERQQRGEF